MLAENLSKYKSGDSISFNEFNILNKESGLRMEYINGKIYYMSESSLEHRIVTKNIRDILIDYFKDKPCDVFSQDMALWYYDEEMHRDLAIFPDIMVICDYNKFNNKGQYWGSPKLIIEVLSPSTKKNDWIYKKEIYYNSNVQEYLIVDTEGIIHVFNFNESKDKELPRVGGKFESSVYTELFFDFKVVFDLSTIAK